MSLTKYIYNSKTLRYEPSPTNWQRIIFTSIGILFCGFLFFVGLIWLQNYIIESPAEKSLVAENDAFSEYKTQLSVQLTSANSQVLQLEKKDKSLYEKIFEVKRIEDHRKTANKEILLSDVPEFREVMETLLSHSADLVSTSTARNLYFSEHASVKKEDLSLLSSIPSFPPIANLDASRLVSGFGVRINPFHKGLYHHDGIDLAASRDSEVLAAGKGIVTAVGFSELQAGFGNYIVIDHGNGYVTRYANLGSISVRYGERILKGQFIGKVGISGGSVAPHVHYEVLKDGQNQDPAKFLMHGLSPDQYESLWQASRKQNQSLD